METEFSIVPSVYAECKESFGSGIAVRVTVAKKKKLGKGPGHNFHLL